MYKLIFRKKFLRKSVKLTKKNPKLQKTVTEVLRKLAEDPFASELNTHKVRDINGNPALASWVTGDLRVIWDFSDEEEYALDLLDIGGHSGKNKVYR